MSCQHVLEIEKSPVTITSGKRTSFRLYFWRSWVLGKIPIESFTGIKYLSIILLQNNQDVNKEFDDNNVYECH